jgi:hypothetical protein
MKVSHAAALALVGWYLTVPAVEASIAVLCLMGCGRHTTRSYTSPTEAHCASQAGVPLGSDLRRASPEQFNAYLSCMVASGALDRNQPVSTPLPPDIERNLREFCRGVGLTDDCDEK